ncbi:MAG: TolC family protein [Myxococcales bacterium]|nr:TolC family protein [Myxococcales bacterium]MCB9609483.1 TolC family protein [Polyangiaceae bacterium]
MSAEALSRHRTWAPAVALAIALGGCATVDPTPDYERARDEVAAATGEESLFQPGEEEEVAARIEELLDGGLTAQESVQVGLLNNGELQARLYEIGVRRADAVQAGLLSNPSLGAVVRFPLGDGSTTTEAGLFGSIAELWQLSPRKRLAESQLERTVLEVAHMAASLAAQTKAAYFRASAATAALAAAEENHATAREFLDLTLERQEAGAATQVDVNAARSEFLEQVALVREARFTVFDAKRQLALALGLAGRPRDLELSDAVTEVPEWSVDLEGLLDVAKGSRLDLQAAATTVEAASNALALENRNLWRNVNAGVSLESEGGDTQLGPGVRLQLPIFDQNQAQIAKAEYRHAQALRRLEALEVRVDQQVRGAFEQHALAVDTARLYEDELLPLRQSSLELARESFAEGKTGFLSVLEAQSRLLAARREYVERLEALAVSIPALEAACGRPLAELLETGASDEGSRPEQERGER